MSIITPQYRTIQQLLQTQTYAIDEYQREYKWDKENIDELLDDLQATFFGSYEAGDDPQKISGYEEYFLGSIIVSKRQDGKNYLIDGQQRVTSLTLLLINLYRAAKAKDLPVAPTIAPLIFSDDLGQPKFNLDIPERLPVIKALFEGVPFSPDGKDESIGTMYARYSDIAESDLLEDLGDLLPHFSYWLMKKVGLIEIATDSDNHAYAIFETMNDRGKPLSPVDMLKAYLLAPIEKVEQRQKANLEWRRSVLDLISWSGVSEPERDANCIKAWLRAQYADSIRERKAGSVDKDWELIGTEFHRWVRDNRKRVGLNVESDNFDFITVHFPFFARAYRTILEASRNYTEGLEAIFYNAHNDFTWQNTVLLAPLCTTDDDNTVRRKLAVTATYLDIWIMRRVVNYVRVGYSSASYAMFTLCRDIRGKSLDELVDILTKKLLTDEVTFQEYSARDRDGLSGFGLNQFSRRYIYHLLARLAAYTDVGSGRVDLFDKYVDRTTKNPFDIEHICPDSYSKYGKEFGSSYEFQRWRNHVSSLLLLPADINRSLKAKPYAQKVPHYAKQNMYAASLSPDVYKHHPQFDNFRNTHGLPFKPHVEWTTAEQQERLKLLECLVAQIWSPDRIKDAAT